MSNVTSLFKIKQASIKANLIRLEKLLKGLEEIDMTFMDWGDKDAVMKVKAMLRKLSDELAKD